MKDKILILYGDANQSLPIAKSLYKKGFQVDAICLSKNGYGYGSRYITKKYLYNNAENIDEYFNYLKKLVKHERYAALLPMRDSMAEVLAKYRDQLLKYSQFVIPDYEIFQRGFNKQCLMELCEEKGYPHPETYIVDNRRLESLNLETLKYPLLIKPNITFGARGMALCNDEEELKVKYPSVYNKYGDCHLQTYIPTGGNQIEVQLYVNEKKELIQSSVIKKYRWYPERGGSSCCNVSYKNDKIVDVCYHILLDLGWVGFADFDTIEDPRNGEILIMEINPRVPACVKSAFVSGIDWADVIVNEYLHKPHAKYKMEREVYLRHLGFEILWFLQSKKRWQTSPNWFNFFGRNVYYQDMSDLKDLKPFFYGTWGNIKKMMNLDFRNEKKGI